MNQVIYKYRVWRAEFPDYTWRVSLKKPLQKSMVRHIFKIPYSVSLIPVLDRRMKNGGKSIL